MKQLNLFDYQQQITPYSFHCEGCGYKKTTGICGMGLAKCYDEHPGSDSLLYEQKRP
ncbi:MAG: hypothetical protein IKF39_01590 [Oscillospiraceae bacterium]|nr:hypothetical protein [Oscillospiraceae bacterium]